jgi:hypothetical protein
VSKLIVSIRVERRGIFPFLKLPRELRNDIYCRVLGIQAGVSKLVHDSVKFQACEHARLNVTSPVLVLDSNLLLTNHILRQEYAETLYHNSRFFVTLDSRSHVFRNKTLMQEDPEFHPPSTGWCGTYHRSAAERCIPSNERDVEAAVPHGWHLPKIEDLCLRIDLGTPGNCATSLDSFDFSAMANMASLTH